MEVGQGPIGSCSAIGKKKCSYLNVREEKLGLRRRKKQETGGNCVTRSVVILAPHQMLLG
jgi:hypothetical protein